MPVVLVVVLAMPVLLVVVDVSVAAAVPMPLFLALLFVVLWKEVLAQSLELVEAQPQLELEEEYQLNNPG